MNQIIGIDFGTTNSCMAVMKNGVPVIIPNNEGSNFTPSIVSFINDEVLVGESAKKYRLLNPELTVTSIKSLLGKKHKDIINFAENFPFKLVRDDNDFIKIEIKNKFYTPQEIVAFILQKMKLDAELYLETEINETVLTIPSRFGSEQIKALKESAELAGLRVRRIITEPTSACLYVGFNRPEDSIISIFDLGGGSLDVSIIEIGDGVFEVLSTHGDTNLGGDDFDYAISQWLFDELNKKEKIDLKLDNRIIVRFKEASEKAKIELSESKISNIYIPYLPIRQTIKDFETTIDRDIFRNICSKLIDKAKAICEQAIEFSKRDGEWLPSNKELVFVGGSTRIPFIRELISNIFKTKLNNKINPDEVVCLGAAIQAGVLEGKVKDVLLLDVTSNSLGINVFDKNRRVFLPIIPNCTTIPTKQRKTFLDREDINFVRTFNIKKNKELKTKKFEQFIQEEYLPPISVNNGLKHFEIDIIESDGYKERVIGNLGIGGVPTLNLIEVTFDIDANGVFSVQMIDAYSGIKNYVKVEVSTNFTQNELIETKNAFEQIEQRKKENRYKQNILHSAQNYIFKSEKQLLSFEHSISIESKMNIHSLIDSLQESIKDEHIEDISKILQSLEQTWNYISQEIYLNTHNMENRQIKIFISYAHDDNVKGLVDLFYNELKKQLKSIETDYIFQVFKDDQILLGEDWNERLQDEVKNADIAILLLSSSFLTSDYISKNELAVFLEINSNMKNQILCPIYFDPFNFNKYLVLKRYQFFKPNGTDYGPSYAYLKDDLCYGDLVEFDPQSGLPLPNRNRSRYMVSLVQEIEKSLKSLK